MITHMDRARALCIDSLYNLLYSAVTLYGYTEGLSMDTLQATLSAIDILATARRAALDSPVIYGILSRAGARLERDARAMLTGGIEHA